MDDWGPPTFLFTCLAVAMIALLYLFGEGMQAQGVVDSMNAKVKITERHCAEFENCASTVDVKLPTAKTGEEYSSTLIIENHTTKDFPVVATIDQQRVFIDESENVHVVANETIEVDLGFVEAGGTIEAPYEIVIPAESEDDNEGLQWGGALTITVSEGAMAA